MSTDMAFEVGSRPFNQLLASAGLPPVQATRPPLPSSVTPPMIGTLPEVAVTDGVVGVVVTVG